MMATRIQLFTRPARILRYRPARAENRALASLAFDRESDKCAIYRRPRPRSLRGDFELVAATGYEDGAFRMIEGQWLRRDPQPEIAVDAPRQVLACALQICTRSCKPVAVGNVHRLPASALLLSAEDSTSAQGTKVRAVPPAGSRSCIRSARSVNNSRAIPSRTERSAAVECGSLALALGPDRAERLGKLGFDCAEGPSVLSLRELLDHRAGDQRHAVAGAPEPARVELRVFADDQPVRYVHFGVDHHFAQAHVPPDGGIGEYDRLVDRRIGMDVHTGEDQRAADRGARNNAAPREQR